jgi:hypothetical protein
MNHIVHWIWRQFVSDLDGMKPWETYPPEKPHGTRDAFYRAELGAPEPMLTQLKETQQLMAKGGDHTSAKFMEARELQRQGGDRRSEQASNASLPQPVGKRCDSTYIRARLERDGKVELLSQVDNEATARHQGFSPAPCR